MNKAVYKRPDKPRTMYVRPREAPPAMAGDLPEAPIMIHVSTECHVTPPLVASRMADYLHGEGHIILEPSAGTGSLIAEVIDQARAVHAVELNLELSDALLIKFPDQVKFSLWQMDFTTWRENSGLELFYTRILMNPPFQKVKRHMEAAIDLLAPGGRIIALVPITYHHDQAETLEELGPETFSSAQVNTKIIELEMKP